MVEQSIKINEILSLENVGVPDGESFMSILNRQKKSKQNELAQCEVSFTQAYCFQIFFERSVGGGGNNTTGGVVGHLSSQKKLKFLEPMKNSENAEKSIFYRITQSLLVQQKINFGSPIENKLKQENSESLDTSRIISTGLIKPDEYAQHFQDKDEIAGARLYSPVSLLHEDMLSADKKNIINGEALHQTLSNTQQFIKKSISTGDPGVELSSTKNCELEYQFQRWNGDHSVRVSLPTEFTRESMIKLIPSDIRVADALYSKLHLIPDVLTQQQKENGREHPHAEEEEE